MGGRTSRYTWVTYKALVTVQFAYAFLLQDFGKDAVKEALKTEMEGKQTLTEANERIANLEKEKQEEIRKQHELQLQIEQERNKYLQTHKK